jgi:hypothetical protein
MNGDYDDLDRALMALPLEEPPVGLRDSILAATIYAPPLESIALRTWEIVLIGTLLAVGSWLAIALAQNVALTSQLIGGFQEVVAALAAPTTFLWLACGATVAFGASLYNVVPRRVTVRSGHS